jgi:hypothetical protein
MSELKEELIRILGENALSIGEMQVSKNVQKLAKAVNYLVLQLKMTANMSENEDIKDYAELIIKNTKDILSK